METIFNRLKELLITRYHPISSSSQNFKPEINVDEKVSEYFKCVFGENKWSKIRKSLGKPPLKTTLRVNTIKTTTMEVINKLESFKEYKPKAHKSIPNVIIINGTGPHLLNYQKIKNLKKILIYRKAAESVLRGADIFVPGIIATSPGINYDETVTICMGLESYTNGITRGTILGSEENPNYYYIGIGIAKMSRNEIFRNSNGIAVKMTNSIYNLPSFNNILRGEIMLQNLPSIAVAVAAKPRDGDRILDMCAAPGGKCTALAILMKDRGNIIALDRTKSKVKMIKEMTREFDLKSIKAYKMDATKAIKKDNNNKRKNKEINKKEERKRKVRIMRNIKLNEDEEIEECEGFEIESFDVIILDPPCSALGLRPRFLHEQTIEELEKHSKYQKKFIDIAIKLLKPGGTLIYSTCTINPSENEENVIYILKNNCMKLENIDNVDIGSPGLVKSHDGKVTWLNEKQSRCVKRFYPDNQSDDTIGFFISKFSKTI